MKHAILSFKNCMLAAMCLCAVVLLDSIQISAQQTGGVLVPVAGSEVVPDADSASKDSSYRLGPGDIIQLRVSKHAELSRDSIRVDNNGRVVIPRIDGELQAACRTERELASVIEQNYDSFLVNPEVEISVREFNSQPVSVIGAVNQPGRFQLQRSARLLELLMLVNGPSGSAGRTVHVVHTSDGLICDGTDIAKPSDTAFVTYELEKTLRAEGNSNPFLLPGDIVRIPDADQVFVIGNVRDPKALPLREPITLSRAIAMASGVLPESNTEKIRILRHREGAGQIELVANLKAINKRQAEDIVLQANDVVEVPGASGGRRILQGITKSLFPGLMNYPLYVLR